MDDLEIELGKLCQKWIERVGLDEVVDALDLQVMLLEDRVDLSDPSSVPNPSLRLH